MKYSEIREASLGIMKRNPRRTPYFVGPPGGGKSALAMDVMQALGIPRDDVIQFFASTKEPSDFAIPAIVGDSSVFRTQQMFYEMRRGQLDRPRGIILEEMSDANIPMQNAICGVIHDRKVGEIYLDQNVYIICTGNRTEDKSGAQRLMTKLGNRVFFFDYETNLDDWCNWALGSNIDLFLIQFLRFRPHLLHAFDPSNRSSPTPRAWEMVNDVPTDLPRHVLMHAIAGAVGNGPATEYVAFREIASKLPNIDDVIMNPEKAEVPTDPATLYALTGAIAHRADSDNFHRVVKYINRLKPEFQVMCITDAQKLKPEIRRSKAYVDWALKNASVIL